MRETSRVIGQQIRAAREAAGITEKELAQVLGVPPHRVDLWEQGAPEPLDVTTLVRIARALGVRFIIE
jgi:transcriptional regulator with XRE-family HTH domain